MAQSVASAVLTAKAGSRRIFCRTCLDWSERRYHVAAQVGAEICRCYEEKGWLIRRRDSRAVTLTPAGQSGLRKLLGVAQFVAR